MLVIASPGDSILGHIEFFKTVNYLDEFELSYQVYDPEQHEGTARGAWYNGGRHHDVEIYAILHDEVITSA
jgi:hypothetical protein